MVSDNDEIYRDNFDSENDWMSTSSDNDTVSTSDNTSDDINGDTVDEYVDQEPVADDLVEWAIRHKCTLTALNELLSILTLSPTDPGITLDNSYTTNPGTP